MRQKAASGAASGRGTVSGMRTARWLLVLVCLGGASGCARVAPWQRGKLASPAMTAAAGNDEFVRVYRAKVLESKTGGGLPGSAPGGGCGCTQ